MKKVLLSILLFAAITLPFEFAFDIHSFLYNRYSTDDIQAHFQEGARILAGENPYERILSSDLKRNDDKYATYFPLFYCLAAVTQSFGLTDYWKWLEFWTRILLVAKFLVAFLLFYELYRTNRTALAVVATYFWLYNRWSLHATHFAFIDFIPILFLLLAMVLFRKHMWGALLLFSFSLAIKQIAIFAVPLFLIWVWQVSEQRKENGAKNLVLAAAAIAIIPVVTSLPFLVINAQAYIKSILFSVTRIPEGQTEALISYLKWEGLFSAVPMIVVLVIVYIAAFQKQIGPYTGVLLAMCTFIFFNKVFFHQYMLWIVPFLPMVVRDFQQRPDFD